jgi:hypothetical protein
MPSLRGGVAGASGGEQAEGSGVFRSIAPPPARTLMPAGWPLARGKAAD